MAPRSVEIENIDVAIMNGVSDDRSERHASNDGCRGLGCSLQDEAFDILGLGTRVERYRFKPFLRPSRTNHPTLEAKDGEFFGDVGSCAGRPLECDPDSYVDMLAEDAVMEFPYSPDGMPEELEGKEAIADHLTRLSKVIAFDQIDSPAVHRTGDPEVTILEFAGLGKGLNTGVPYRQRYISVIRTRDGRIAHYRDYWNPLATLRSAKGNVIADAITVTEIAHD